jgi:hypothetical protein
LPEDVRGEFMCLESLADHARSLGIEVAAYPNPYEMERRLHRDKRPTIVAGHADPRFLARSGRENIIAMHGVGFVFDAKSSHPNYPGTTKNRELTRLMLATNERIAEIERAANPHVTVEVVGCAKLDKWHANPRPYVPTGKPVIAAAWHWECQVARETRSAFYEYRDALKALSDDYKVIGHGHPHIIDKIAPLYEADGIEVVRELAEVFDRADMMIFDATSAGFEFASLGRPVVVCQRSDYRAINYGGMFHLREQLGIVCNKPDALRLCVEMAKGDPPGIRQMREHAVVECYAYTDGHCAERAAAAIVRYLESRGN